MHTFSLDSTCRKEVPRWPYEAMASAILGARYELSVRFVGTTSAKRYNQTYRAKDYVPDVLAFPLTDTIGQIILTPHAINKKASAFGLTARHYTGFLFIHACLHLKGHDHGPAMERAEKRYCAQFAVIHPTDKSKT